MTFWQFITFLFDPLGWDAPSIEEEIEACAKVTRGEMSTQEFYRWF